MSLHKIRIKNHYISLKGNCTTCKHKTRRLHQTLENSESFCQVYFCMRTDRSYDKQNIWTPYFSKPISTLELFYFFSLMGVRFILKTEIIRDMKTAAIMAPAMLLS